MNSKTFICIAVMMLGISSVFAQARAARGMRQYGPATIAAATDDTVIFEKSVMELDDAGFLKLTTLGRDLGAGLKNRVYGPSVIPVGYVGDGSAKWAFTDIGTATIVGFTGKSVFLKYIFTAGPDAGKTRYYAYRVGSTTRDCRVVGSTSNITTANVVQESSNGRTLWLEAAKDYEVAKSIAKIWIQQFTTRLNGTLVRPRNARSEQESTTFTTTVLPEARDRYINDTTGGKASAYK